MKNNIEQRPILRNRKNEEGASLIMVMLISFLLLGASAGLLLEVSMNTANVTDATAEQQAYYAAESGIQETLNVLRGNRIPDQLIDPSKPASDPVNKINFSKAVNAALSNAPGDPSTSAKLSRWLKYNYTPSGISYADRVTLGSGTYTERNGYAYTVTISDPDNTGSIVAFNTNGSIDGSGSSKTFGSGGNTATISYINATVNNLNVSTGIANTAFGQFKIASSGSGATIPDDVRFEINLQMTLPFTATRTIRGFIKAGTISANSVGTVSIDFDSGSYIVMGSTITLDSDPLTPNAPNTNSGVKAVTGTMTRAEPTRVVVNSIGYGPRGAKKQLETVVQKNFFNGMTAPSTLTLMGPSTGFLFNPGSSNVTEYSGDDVASNAHIPPIGTTNNTNLSMVMDSVNGRPPHPFNGNVIGTPANVASELPEWLKTTSNLDGTVQSLKNLAQFSGRYYSSGQTPPNLGDNLNAKGITFVDGDLELGGPGGGILVCTGKLTLHGNFNFNGLIIVTGANGVDRRGGGNGVLQGFVVVAPYNPGNLAAGFLPANYNLSGGGNSNIVYNSSSLANGLVAVSNFVLGVVEK